jgi:hypothetical protein
MYTLCKEVVHVFAEEYFREPNVADTAPAIVNQLVKKIACMLGSVDCMRWDGRTGRLYGRGNGHAEGWIVIIEHQQIPRCGTLSSARQALTMI